MMHVVVAVAGELRVEGKKQWQLRANRGGDDDVVVPVVHHDTDEERVGPRAGHGEEEQQRHRLPDAAGGQVAGEHDPSLRPVAALPGHLVGDGLRPHHDVPHQVSNLRAGVLCTCTTEEVVFVLVAAWPD